MAGIEFGACFSISNLPQTTSNGTSAIFGVFESFLKFQTNKKARKSLQCMHDDFWTPGNLDWKHPVVSQSHQNSLQ